MLPWRTGSALGTVAFLLALAAASPVAAADAALVAAAKKEGEVVWYTTQIVSQLVRPVSAAFEKKYGIRVRATDRRGNVGKWTAESRIWVP